MSKEQRLVFVIGKNPDGKMNVNMSFHPPLDRDQAKFEQKPMYQREMQNMAAMIGGYVMKALADQGSKEVVDASGLKEKIDG